MKTTYRILFISLLLMNSLVSCQKYLDIVEKSNYKPIKSAEDCQLLLDDYSTMNTNYPIDIMISSDDYFIADKDFGNVSWDLEGAAFYSWSSNAIRAAADPHWQLPYKRVFQANLVLEQVATLRKENSTPTSVLDGLEGAALFYRSYNFWVLAQMYAQPYSPSSDNTNPGIPLRFTSDLNEVTSRGTVKETYDQITSDLQKAAALLPAQVSISSRPSKASAYALLSRCFLSMSDFQNALTNADLTLASNSTLLDFNMLTSSGNRYIKTKFNAEILFQAIAAEDYYGLFSNQYVNINLDLLGQYATNDLRNSVFFRDLNNDGFMQFNGSYDASSTLFTGLATDEIYLIRAECYARKGNVPGAMADLNTLLKNRYSNAVPYVDRTASSPDDALGKVLLERRKELVFRGLRWSDLRRLNLISKTSTTLTRVLNQITYTLPPNDLRYTLLIPQGVISNSTMAQNPR